VRRRRSRPCALHERRGRRGRERTRSLLLVRRG